MSGYPGKAQALWERIFARFGRKEGGGGRASTLGVCVHWAKGERRERRDRRAGRSRGQVDLARRARGRAGRRACSFGVVLGSDGGGEVGVGPCAEAVDVDVDR